MEDVERIAIVDLKEVAAEALGKPVARTFRRGFDQLQRVLAAGEEVLGVTIAYHWFKQTPFVLTRTRCLVATRRRFRKYEVMEFPFSRDLVFRVKRRGGRNILTSFSFGAEHYDVNFAPDTPDREVLVSRIAELTAEAGGASIVERRLETI